MEPKNWNNMQTVPKLLDELTSMSANDNSFQGPLDFVDTDYVSCIKLNGVPIPSPVLTDEFRTEIRRFKEQAIQLEAKMKEKRAQDVQSRLDDLINKIENTVHICTNEKSEFSRNGTFTRSRINKESILDVNRFDMATSNGQGAITSVSDDEDSCNNVDHRDSQDVANCNLTEEITLKIDDETHNCCNIAESDGLRVPSSPVAEDFVIDVSDQLGKLGTTADVPNFTDGNNQQASSDANRQLDSRLTDAFTIITNSTDLSPYMKNKNSSIESPQSTVVFRESDIKLAAIQMSESVKATPVLSRDSSTLTNTSNSVDSLATVKEVLAGEDDKTPNKMIRRNSYTLDTPSPALVKAMAENDSLVDGTSSKDIHQDNEKSEFSRNGTFTRSRINKESILDVNRFDMATSNGQGTITSVSDDEDSCNNVDHWDSQDVANCNLTEEITLKIEDETHNCCNIAESDGLRVPSSPVAEDFVIDVSDQLGKLGTTADVPNFTDGNNQQASSDANRQLDSRLTDAFTIITNSTDLSPYMKNKNSSIESPQSTVVFRESDIKLAAIQMSESVKATPVLSRDSSTLTNTSNSVDSLATVKEVLAGEDDKTPNKMIRRNSYTLDTPSPVLVKAMAENDSLVDGTSSKDIHQDNTSNNVVSLSRDNVTMAMEQVEGNTAYGKQKHLRRYLDQLSISPHVRPESTNEDETKLYFPSLQTDTVVKRTSSLYLIANQNRFFPLPSNSAKITSSENIEGARNSSKITNGIPESVPRSDQRPLCDSSPNRSIDSTDQMLEGQDATFQAIRNNLQKQHRQQMEELLQHQWTEQLSLQKQFIEEQQRNYYNNYDRCTSALSMCSSSHTDEDVNGHKDRLNTSDVAPSVQDSAAETSPTRHRTINALNADTTIKFSKLPAMVKGHLTRRLMKTDQVQTTIQTVKDTLNFALKLQSEKSIKLKKVTAEDVALHRRLISQITATCYHLHEIFFETSKEEQMAMIRQHRNAQNKNHPEATHERKRSLSSATIKCLARRVASRSQSRGESGSDIGSDHDYNLFSNKRRYDSNGDQLRTTSSKLNKVRRSLYSGIDKENTKPLTTKSMNRKVSMPINKHWR